MTMTHCISLPEDRITKEEASELILRFTEEFLDREVELTETDAYSGYEAEDYVTYRDERGGTYLVQLSHNMLIRYDSPDSNIGQSVSNKYCEAYMLITDNKTLFVKDFRDNKVRSFHVSLLEEMVRMILW